MTLSRFQCRFGNSVHEWNWWTAFGQWQFQLHFSLFKSFPQSMVHSIYVIVFNMAWLFFCFLRPLQINDRFFSIRHFIPNRKGNVESMEFQPASDRAMKLFPTLRSAREFLQNFKIIWKCFLWLVVFRILQWQMSLPSVVFSRKKKWRYPITTNAVAKCFSSSQRSY